MAVMSKMDLAAAVEFDETAARANIQAARPGMQVFTVSSKTSAGMDEFFSFLARRSVELRAATPARTGVKKTSVKKRGLLLSLLSIIALGFFLGMRHATDPDHVIAVTTIVTRQRQLTRAALTGAFWGVGHTLTILVVGAVIILFNVVIPTRIGLSMEFSVALMLIFLGTMNVAAFLRALPSFSARAETGPEILHSHPHTHGDYVHSHAHGHAPEAHPHRADRTPLAQLDRLFGKLALYRPVRPFIVGVVHGLAGSAAVALLVLTTIPNPRWAVVYLLVFGLGTVAGMMLITMSIASAFTFLGKGRQTFSHRLGLVSGLLSLVFGVLLVYQIGFAGGLFTSHPHWTPR
jgi:ABC-type nickel/cobalt efflux system permease component RcnA